VLLNTGLLRSGLVGTLPPRLQGAVEMLETDVQELVRVAGNVLDLGSLSAGVQPAGDELVRPREAVIEQLRRVEPAAKQKGLTLAVHVPRSLPVVQTDPERFGRILLHLFANAVKFTDEGRIDVYLERTTRPTPRGRREQVLLIRVVDTGRGMPVEEIERVFEPFAQVDEGARTESRRRGLGLGLTLANRLAASIGGSIALESEAGRGTTATFTLPWRRAHG
jgi:protein-histidine pros-kinase